MYKAEILQHRHLGRTRQALCGCAVCLRMSLHTWELTVLEDLRGGTYTSPLALCPPQEAAGVVWGCLCSIHHLTWAFFPVSVCTGFQIPAFSVSLPVSMVHDCVCALSGHPCVCMNESTCLRFRHVCRVWFMGCWGSNPGILHAREALYQLSYTPSP